MTPYFLTVEEVVVIHRAMIAAHGGAAGVRDPGLLESAVLTPQATFGGRFIHESLEDMAAAYLFHLAVNHAFVDGNKRTAWAATRIFLRRNGFRMKPRARDAVAFVEAIAGGAVRQKAKIAAWILKH